MTQRSDDEVKLRALAEAYSGTHLVAAIALLDERDAALREAREALAPFAVLGGAPDMQAYHDLEDDVVLYKNSGNAITASDVREARRVLGTTSEMHYRRSQPATPLPDDALADASSPVPTVE